MLTGDCGSAPPFPRSAISEHVMSTQPYRGLNFYREEDAKLFHGRGNDVRDCTALLLGFGVKLLLLQGSSGSGKSSFLRAGLIPHLKSGLGEGDLSRHRAFFLSTNGGVIRCTADPTGAIRQ